MFVYKFCIRKIMLFLILLSTTGLCVLKPGEILVVVNEDIAASVRVGEYYCLKRMVPQDNIVRLHLGGELVDTISRKDYDEKLAGPVRELLDRVEYSGRIRCLVTTYGVPYKAGRGGPVMGPEGNAEELELLYAQKGEKLRAVISQLQLVGFSELKEPMQVGELHGIEEILKKLNYYDRQALGRIEEFKDSTARGNHVKKWFECYSRLYGVSSALKAARGHGYEDLIAGDKFVGKYRAEEQKDREVITAGLIEKWDVSTRLMKGYYKSLEKIAGLAGLLAQLRADIDYLAGKETGSSVDSELSMVRFDKYELYRWQKNELYENTDPTGVRTIMVSRLDGPSEAVARGLVDKAIAAERNGLNGRAYIDMRGIKDGQDSGSPAYYDQSLEDTAFLIGMQTKLPVVVERTSAVFGHGECPLTALYCGWYSLEKYVDAFDFVDGAVGYHIASFEAADLRDANSPQWCASMLCDGITATLGSVAEPYLHSFPEPRRFFLQLIKGRCVVEAFYIAKPFNSWQLLLIADPLYRPFRNHQVADMSFP
ncbi:MAG: TIGR03790 family protein [Planctomycetota bacterium]